jgi:hypothetical protein
MKFFPATLIIGLLFCGNLRAEAPMKFREVYDLLRTNLTDISESDLDNLAAKGLINELDPAVQFAKEDEEKEPPQPLKTAVYNDTFAFIRLPVIDSTTSSAFDEAYKNLSTSNRLRGLVLDLRYSGGRDYNAAARLADRFLKKEEPLLKWNDTVVSSTKKTNAIELPVAILVNEQTSGPAEALAAVLREKEAGLVIGANTAGRTRIFENFTLSTGQQIRVGKTPVQLGDGKALPAKGVVPDIAVPVEPANQLAWYNDPYKNISRVLGQTVGSPEPSANPAFRRMNEAELVRRHREGADVDDAPGRTVRRTGRREGPEGEAATRPGEEPSKPVITDPVLARSLDFLKGVAVLKSL